MTLHERIEQARQAQQAHEQRHDVQQEIPGWLDDMHTAGIPPWISNRDPGDETQED